MHSLPLAFGDRTGYGLSALLAALGCLWICRALWRKDSIDAAGALVGLCAVTAIMIYASRVCYDYNLILLWPLLAVLCMHPGQGARSLIVTIGAALLVLGAGLPRWLPLPGWGGNLSPFFLLQCAGLAALAVHLVWGLVRPDKTALTERRADAP